MCQRMCRNNQKCDVGQESRTVLFAVTADKSLCTYQVGVPTVSTILTKRRAGTVGCSQEMSKH